MLERARCSLRGDSRSFWSGDIARRHGPLRHRPLARARIRRNDRQKNTRPWGWPSGGCDCRPTRDDLLTLHREFVSIQTRRHVDRDATRCRARIGRIGARR